jgi:hypothetical protein
MTKEQQIQKSETTNWVSALARDTRSSNLVNFPFAFGVYLLFIASGSAMAWGFIMNSVWLTATGFCLTLIASSLYGLSHFD